MSVDWTQLYKTHKGQWVALKDDYVTVVGQGKTLEGAREDAKKNGFAEPYLTRVPEKVIQFVG